MRLSLFDYNLPKELIAQKPIRPRDHSRLMVLDRKTGQIEHRHFYNIAEYLKPGDVLVLNDTKVFPARLIGKKETGGKIEVFLLQSINTNTWSCLLGGKGRREGLSISVSEVGQPRLLGKIVEQLPNGICHIKFNQSGAKLMTLINKLGQAPTPPYVKRLSNLKEYQTVFAKKTGSVAAPTAGFHFTKKLINQLTRLGVQIEYVTLHVGYGTFQPVKETNIEQHKMHPEFVEVNISTHQRLSKAKKDGQRIIAVGTTSARVLESLPKKTQSTNQPIHKLTNIYIYPGYKFKFVDAMITNFHLPKSTLILLVSALAGRTKILKAYNQAVKKR
ncbi:tRNA preQ1(34) S-adenosylmethionine ribosyltransferase-isomerase QueA, partial [Patescibacteria group bacterium]|nr:tRNA preQ1(34) S-adenosylmethionine ribosyltransferase-isomerase QueA [Patescibacteria group bacterium]MBU1890200.1 tRNA preQ1(34) S-adenosylmethionine ribosyltransferase-isomerase QueA [Patescibacteria group bacterium]